jgi:hypothetical protein
MLDDKTGSRFYVRRFTRLVSTLPTEVVKRWVGAGVERARRLARHLPPPYRESDGTPVVPALTSWILTEFERDDSLFREFRVGLHSFRMYYGDIAAQHEAEAAVRELSSITPFGGFESGRRWRSARPLNPRDVNEKRPKNEICRSV